MIQNSGGDTINQGGAPEPANDSGGAESDVTGNVAEKGEKAPPADRGRGETSDAESGGAIDMETAHERAS